MNKKNISDKSIIDFEEFYPGYIYNGQLFYNLYCKKVCGNIYTLFSALFKMLM